MNTNARIDIDITGRIYSIHSTQRPSSRALGRSCMRQGRRRERRELSALLVLAQAL